MSGTFLYNVAPHSPFIWLLTRIARYRGRVRFWDKTQRNCNERLKLPEPLVLPRAKSGYRKDKRHYRDLLNDEECQRIAKLFAREIELFGYEF